VTATRGLDITPVWSPDTKAIAYTSYRTGFQDVLVSFIYEGRQFTVEEMDARRISRVKIETLQPAVA